MDYRYKSGLFFDKTLALNLDKQTSNRIDINFPSLIIIDGGQGQGKTTLMVQIIDYINNKFGLGPCSLKLKNHPQLALGGKEFIRNFNICKAQGWPIIGYDEAGDFSRRGSISRFNSMINRRFETFRSSNIIVILCLPNFNILDNNLFDLNVPRILLHLKDRELTRNYGNYAAYSLYGMNWIRYWFEKLNKAVRYKCYEKTSPNFQGHFKDLSPARKEELRKLSDFGKDKESQIAEIKAEGLLTYSDLSYKVNMSIPWVRLMISKKKLKAERIVKRVKYFKPEIVDILAELRSY